MMGLLLCVCPVALGMVIATLVADLYLFRSLVREWTRKHE